MEKGYQSISILAGVGSLVILVLITIFSLSMLDQLEAMREKKLQKNNAQAAPTLSASPQITPTSEVLSEEEKQRIDLWIFQNSLNQYGDLKETIYAGGTPLFNEATGEMIDRYQYILKNHPTKPWR